MANTSPSKYSCRPGCSLSQARNSTDERPERSAIRVTVERYHESRRAPLTQRQHVARVAHDAGLVGDEALGQCFGEIDAVAHAADLEMEVDDALAARVAHVADDRAV